MKINLNGFFEECKKEILDKLQSVINWREITILEYMKFNPELTSESEMKLIQLKELHRKIKNIKEDI